MDGRLPEALEALEAEAERLKGGNGDPVTLARVYGNVAACQLAMELNRRCIKTCKFLPPWGAARVCAAPPQL